MIFLILSSLLLLSFVFRRPLIRWLLPWLIQKLVRKMAEQHTQPPPPPKQPPQKHTYAEDIDFEELDD
ncbi:MAG: hypothetical protein ACON42_07955 [Flavobacteriaceae bacterium]